MTKTIIQSRQNKWIKRVRRAIDDHEDEIAVEGPKMIDDAITRGWDPVVILEEQSESRRYDSILVDPALFRELATTTTTQGVIGLFPRPQTSFATLLDTVPKRVVALDAIQDPGNVGTIIRLCAAFGASGVARLPGTADPWSQKVIRASAGSILNVPVVDCSHDELIRFALEHRFSIFTADPDATSSVIPPTSDIVLVLGSEGQGLSERWQRIAHGVGIRMTDHVESINVASAAAILLSRLYGSE